MSKFNRRKKRRHSETGALQILEEAFHLLRTTDLRNYWMLYLGMVPFSITLMVLVAEMSRRSGEDGTAAIISAILVLSYFWLRYCQAKFCSGLWETISPGIIEPLKPGRRLPRLAAYWCIQAFHGPLVLVGLFLAIPFGWIIAALENSSVLVLTRDGGDRPFRSLVNDSLRYSNYQWAQNHGILLTFFFVSLFSWMNLVGTCLMIPMFAKSIFGIDSIFSLNPIAAIANTTFVLGSVLLTWMVISPMMMAAYTLRCFYAESRSTGADILSRLAACQKSKSREKNRDALSKVALIGLAFVLQMPTATSAVAAEDVQVASADELREEIGQTLQQPKYRWKLPRHLRDEDSEEKGWVAEQLNGIALSVRTAVEKAGDWIKEMLDKLSKQTPEQSDKSSQFDSGFFKNLGSTLSISLMVVVAGLLVWLGFIAYRKYRGSEKARVTDAGSSGPIDLESEDIVATQLPEDEWMRLAQEQMAKGESRLAIRALFLATLANLGDRGLLRIARFKSNRDYSRELEMRARQEIVLREAFTENTTVFERAWYGLHQLGEGTVEQFMCNYERIAKESAGVSVLANAQK